jgi:hypothetical protein
MSYHDDKQVLQVARVLADKVIALDKMCDRSKLLEIELEHLKDIVAMARMITADILDDDRQGAFD